MHDFGVDRDTRAFLVMELLEGTNLRDELTRQTRLPADRSLRILRSVCAAVEAAHARDLVHRDLKPENIFLTRAPTGEVTKVLDFGIAKFVSATSASEAATAEGTVLGTVRYPPPLRKGLDPTPMQALFAVEYLVDGNGKQAAIRAGCSPRSAEVCGRSRPTGWPSPC